MKIIRFDPEKREKLIAERWIDLYVVACMIQEGELLDDVPHPTRTNQRVFIILYDWYPCKIPYVETETEIFIKTAFQDRKLKKFYSLSE